MSTEGKSKLEKTSWVAGIVGTVCALIALGMSLRPDPTAVDVAQSAQAPAVPAVVEVNGPHSSSREMELEVARARVEQARMEKELLQARLEAEANAAEQRRLTKESEMREQIEAGLPDKLYAALSCASSLGSVTDLKVLSREDVAQGFRLKGSYAMQGQGLFGGIRIPGYFDAIASHEGALISLRWKEQGREEDVAANCLT
jgi:hypothetical protein